MFYKYLIILFQYFTKYLIWNYFYKYIIEIYFQIYKI